MSNRVLGLASYSYVTENYDVTNEPMTSLDTHCTVLYSTLQQTVIHPLVVLSYALHVAYLIPKAIFRYIVLADTK